MKGANGKLLEAIRNGRKPLTLIDDDEARREAKMQEEASMTTIGKEWKQSGHMWVDRMQQDLYWKRGVRPYVGKRNGKLKGRRRNHVERITIERINRK